MWRAFLAGAFIAALALFSACDDDGDDEPPPTEISEATATTAAEATSTEEPGTSPSSDSTRIPELDAIIDALRSEDPEALRPLIRFSGQPCGPGLPALPCRPGETEGTLVEAFTVGRCEGDSYRPDEIDVVLGYLSRQRPFAVYRMTPDALGNEDAEYAAITSVDSTGSPTGWVVWIAGGGIIGTSQSCGPVPPSQFVEDLGLTDAVLPPRSDGGTAPPTASTRYLCCSTTLLCSHRCPVRRGT